MPTQHLTQLKMLDFETAPPREKGVLEEAKRASGGIPNMYAYMGNSPGLLETYLAGYNKFREESGFSPVEQEVVFLTISRLNACEYCMAAHSAIASGPSHVEQDVIEAIRNGIPVEDEKLQTLAEFVTSMFETRGRPGEGDVERFLAAGFSERQMLEIVLALAVKTLSNYVNHLADTPLDRMFSRWEWRAEAA
ncbi:MAG: carboxymuconolactone decarboxylase family protein [Solirubrobacteraceae bacterium]